MSGKNYNFGLVVSIGACVLLSGAVWIVVSNLTGYRNSTGARLSFGQQFPLIDPSRQFYKADDEIVNIQPLRDELREIGKNPNVSIYFEVLNTGANSSVNQDAEFYPASLLKLPLVIAVAKKIEHGDWAWNSEIELLDSDKNQGFGDLWKEPTGTRFTVEFLVKQLLVNSDNTAHFMLLRNLGPEDFEQAQEHLGLQDFFSKNQEISAKKYAPILRSLFSSSYLSVSSSEKILELMTTSQFNEFLASGMPVGTKFAHKIGVDDSRKMYHDSGIVYLPSRPYMLIVMVKNVEVAEADALMREVAQKVYSYMVKYPHVSNEQNIPIR